MRTNGTLNVYSHKNIAVRNSDILIDFGFLRVFYGRYNPRQYNENFYVPKSVNFSDGYPQKNYLMENLTCAELANKRF